MADRKWTKEQLDAINAESGTVLVAAAAGSGKTSVLTERIVRKLTDPERPCAPDELLVVTFTNAAAAEMRQRIYKRLRQKMTEQPERRREFALMQSRLDGMRVCTMDAFCMGFVREHFHACGIESDFLMLEPGEAFVLKQTVAADVVERLYGEDGDAFLALTRLFERGRNDDGLIDSVIRLSDFSLSEPYPAEWLRGVAGHFRENDAARSVFGRIITEDIREGLAYCLLLADGALEDARYDGSLFDKYGPVLTNDREALASLAERFAALAWDDRIAALREALTGMKAKTFRAPNGYTNEPHKLAAAAKRDEIKRLLGAFLGKMCATQEENEEDAAVLAPLADELIRTALLFNETLLARKREMNAFDFPDILHFALEQLADPAAPDGKTALARELSVGFHEILIDEYQDTNRAQESLFTALSKDGGNMFMVGDVKQSIYRFRLASPELFIEKCETYPYYDGKAPRSKIILGTNFRSRRGVIDAVNFIFSSVMSKKCGEIAYNEDEKLYYAEGRYPENGETAFEVDVLADPALSGYEAEARYIAALIRRELDRGASVQGEDGERPALPGDFCILLRSAKGLAEVYAKALREEGLTASVDARDGFFEAAEIRVLLSLLRAIDDPARDVDLLGVMLSPVFGFTADDAARVRLEGRRLSGHSRISLFAAARLCADAGSKKCAALLRALEYYQKLAATRSADEVLRAVLADTSYLAVCGAMRGGEQRKNNVRRLLEYAESGAERMRTLSGFVRYMDALRDNGAKTEGAARAAGTDCVSIMTMHRSKGLEFPFVIIAGTAKETNRSDLRAPLVISHKNGLGLKRQEPENIKSYDTLSSAAIRTELERASMSEELRIFYVALTRAKEKLWIVMAPEKAEDRLMKAGHLLCGDVVPAYRVRNTSAPYQWLLASLLRHPDAAALRQTDAASAETPSHAAVRLIDRLPQPRAAAEPAPAAEPDEAVVARIAQRASFVYRFAPVASARSKHAASAVNEEKFSPEYFARSAPAFLSGTSLTPADRGTATHKFLQYCDFAVCKTAPEEERERLVARGRLTRAEADSVDMESVRAFVNSDLMRRCENASAVYREKEFTIAKSVCEMDPAVPEEFRGEKTVVIGKIDMAFIEPDGAVIVDYKTDNVRDIFVLRERYAGQLALYREAFARITGVPVKECAVYSLKLRQSLTL